MHVKHSACLKLLRIHIKSAYMYSVPRKGVTVTNIIISLKLIPKVDRKMSEFNLIT